MLFYVIGRSWGTEAALSGKSGWGSIKTFSFYNGKFIVMGVVDGFGELARRSAKMF